MIKDYEKNIIQICYENRNNDNIKRMSMVADYVIRVNCGNFLEIGAGFGDSTKELLKISTKYNKKTIVVDPFEDGWKDMPQSYGIYPYNVFLKNIKEFLNNLILIKQSSQESGVLAKIQEQDYICFSYVDGLQYEDAVLNDLILTSSLNVKVICIDDMNRLTSISQVPIAVSKFLKNNKNYKLIYESWMRECYLIAED